MTAPRGARGAAHVRKTRFFEEMNAAVERLRTDPDEWADYHEEQSHRDVTLTDGTERAAEQTPAEVSG